MALRLPGEGFIGAHPGWRSCPAAQQQKPAELGQWQPYKEKDNATANSITNVFHTITAHPQYRDVLVEVRSRAPLQAPRD